MGWGGRGGHVAWMHAYVGSSPQNMELTATQHSTQAGTKEATGVFIGYHGRSGTVQPAWMVSRLLAPTRNAAPARRATHLFPA